MTNATQQPPPVQSLFKLNSEGRQCINSSSSSRPCPPTRISCHHSSPIALYQRLGSARRRPASRAPAPPPASAGSPPPAAASLPPRHLTHLAPPGPELPPRLGAQKRPRSHPRCTAGPGWTCLFKRVQNSKLGGNKMNQKHPLPYQRF